MRLPVVRAPNSPGGAVFNTCSTPYSTHVLHRIQHMFYTSSCPMSKKIHWCSFSKTQFVLSAHIGVARCKLKQTMAAEPEIDEVNRLPGLKPHETQRPLQSLIEGLLRCSV